MMNISINKMKMVIDELQVIQMTYKKQMNVFDNVIREYQSIEREGNDKRILREISEELKDEYCSMKQLREVLTEVVREYENTEKNIIASSPDALRDSPVFKRIDIEETQKILKQFHIKII